MNKIFIAIILLLSTGQLAYGMQQLPETQPEKKRRHEAGFEPMHAQQAGHASDEIVDDVSEDTAGKKVLKKRKKPAVASSSSSADKKAEAAFVCPRFVLRDGVLQPCGRTFGERSPSVYKSHVQDHDRIDASGVVVGEIAGEWRCFFPDCCGAEKNYDGSFRSLGHLVKHVLSVHMKAGQNICSTCGIIFKEPRDYSEHMQLHAMTADAKKAGRAEYKNNSWYCRMPGCPGNHDKDGRFRDVRPFVQHMKTHEAIAGSGSSFHSSSEYLENDDIAMKDSSVGAESSSSSADLKAKKAAFVCHELIRRDGILQECGYATPYKLRNEVHTQEHKMIKDWKIAIEQRGDKWHCLTGDCKKNEAKRRIYLRFHYLMEHIRKSHAPGGSNNVDMESENDSPFVGADLLGLNGFSGDLPHHVDELMEDGADENEASELSAAQPAGNGSSSSSSSSATGAGLHAPASFLGDDFFSEDAKLRSQDLSNGMSPFGADLAMLESTENEQTTGV